MREPLEEYGAHFETALTALEEVLERTVDLSRLVEDGPGLLKEPAFLDAIRYMTGPPISIDDLGVLAVASLTPAALSRDITNGERAIETIMLGLDRFRFPWMSENRPPTSAEREAAARSTAAMLATRRTMTKRANEGKNEQEQLVKDALTAQGFTEVRTRTINTLVDAPGPGEFCGESMFGQKKADIVIRLWDSRVMPLECKVSNSATNSVKRLNNDAAVKAVVWMQDFGRLQVVPSAMLGGVFKLKNLREAQANGLTVWWDHSLKELTDWVETTR